MLSKIMVIIQPMILRAVEAALQDPDVQSRLEAEIAAGVKQALLGTP